MTDAKRALVSSFVVTAAVLTACGPGSGESAGARTGAETAESNETKHELSNNPAPSFSTESIDGKRISLDDLSGKVVLVDFWATWCEPCKKSFPKYQELYVKYKASGLEIAAVSVDDEKGGIPAFAKSHGAKFPVGWDNGKKIADQYKPENMPTAYVIDKNGVVKFVHKGYHDGEEKELEKEIKSLL